MVTKFRPKPKAKKLPTFMPWLRGKRWADNTLASTKVTRNGTKLNSGEAGMAAFGVGVVVHGELRAKRPELMVTFNCGHNDDRLRFVLRYDVDPATDALRLAIPPVAFEAMTDASIREAMRHSPALAQRLRNLVFQNLDAAS